MKNKSQLGAILAVVALVVLVIVIAVAGWPSSEPAAKAAPSAAATKTAAATPKATATPKPTRTATPTATPSPAGISIEFDSCYIPSQQKSMDFASLQEIWAYPVPVHCSSNVQSQGTPSEVQMKALEAAGAEYRHTALKSLYGVCADTEGIPIDKVVSGAQAKELAAAYILCPDHPKAAVIEATIASGQSLIAEEEANRLAIAEGRQVDSGKYLVGVDVQPGVWETVGPKVTECYWEISDAAGNIIENNFINVAPQFSITIPEGAAGFTVQGCTFRKIG
ncbi:hypothetical protein [Arthrobacter sp. zg-Y1110]|uniref:hypothetical protein n=1 Tax=Arthrobacter sp. zg-Y1110 TaxID=2886932 RepID=UPI001D14883B|nr:hypothetical protein [Arthrobacter sp. zg-Y1110]MCC3292602.1 hypothetical protein [Arthrobacter sp. zg-Y1110]UWX86967.1 hypothetical protein N2K99_16575 [Arthrobacter sp. zg-Y1110]